MANKYYPTIGLEIHAELKTETKMFCGCKNNPDEEKPNVNICPVCMAHPGALPVLNKKAIENVIKVGLVVDGEIADFTEFDRKNYFYPDIPKGYQISQYKYPIVSGGHLAGFDIQRVHLEEDTANNKHDRGNFSLIDFNRSGVPLMELVTEPCTFKSAGEAARTGTKFAKELQLILWYLNVSEANMEKGEMRVEANISVSGTRGKLGTKVEVKNLNSFKSAEKAIKFEIDRMIELHESSKASEIVQETRGWDEAKQKTFSQRKKESSQDYRYFPEPDLPKLKLHKAFDLVKMKKELPELPETKRARYKKYFGIKDEDIEVYINDPVLGVWFENTALVLKEKKRIETASNYIVSDFLGLKLKNAGVKILMPNPEDFAELIFLISENKITSRSAKDILAIMCMKGGKPKEIAQKNNMFQISDEDTKRISREVVSENPKVVEDIKKGKENAIMSLVGQVMKKTKGSANPEVARSSILGIINDK